MVLTKLKKIREGKGWTQVELAEKVLLSERTVISLEGGASTTVNNAKRFAITLGVKLKDLVEAYNE